MDNLICLFVTPNEFNLDLKATNSASAPGDQVRCNALIGMLVGIYCCSLAVTYIKTRKEVKDKREVWSRVFTLTKHLCKALNKAIL